MKSEEFRVWLREVKMMTSSTVNSRVKNCEVVERYEGNLDTLFSKDKLSGLLKKLTYSKFDARNNALPSHNIPIDGNIYTGTATYKSAVTRYLEFKKYSLSSPSQSNQEAIRTYSSEKIFPKRNMNMDWPVWELPSSSTILNLARMIIPYIRFLHPSIVEAVVEDNEKHREVWKRNLIERNIDPDFYLWEKSSCAFPGIRRHSGSQEISFYKKQIERKNFQINEALRLDDNTFPKHIWSFIFLDSPFKNKGPSEYSLAHLADHKEYKNRNQYEFFGPQNHNIKFHGLYTCVSNTIYLPNELLKPTDFNSDIRILFLNKIQDLYGSICNIIHPSFRVKPSIWNIHDFDWAEPAGDLANIGHFLEFRHQAIESLWQR